MSELNYKDFLKKHNMVDSFDSFAVWEYQQAKIDDLKKQVDRYGRLTTSIRNEFDLWSDDSEFADVIEAQIENLEALRGENESKPK